MEWYERTHRTYIKVGMVGIVKYEQENEQARNLSERKESESFETKESFETFGTPQTSVWHAFGTLSPHPHPLPQTTSALLPYDFFVLFKGVCVLA